MKKKSRLIVSLSTLFLLLIFGLTAHADRNPMETIAIQDGGRVKPLDTFARETMQIVTGKETFEGKAPIEIMMTWLLQPTMWEEKEFIEIKHHLVKSGLKLPEKKLYSPREIFANDRFTTLLQDLQAKRETKAKLDPYYSSLQRLETQLFMFKEIASGRLLRLIPNAQEGESWKSLPDFSPAEQEAFMGVTKALVSVLGAQAEGKTDAAAREELHGATQNFIALAKGSNPQVYPLDQEMKIENFYNHFHPFRWAWICYMIGALLMIITWASSKPKLYRFSWGFVSLGLLLHIFGMAIRVYLMGRPPVTNMYETVVWVGFGAIVFAMVIEAVYKWRFILLAGAAVGAFCLILANLAPAVLDKSLQPLEPVLRSNFWLTTHVMSITISYAAFFLAFAMGDIALFYYYRGEKKHDAEIKAIVLAIYRCKQIGVAFLTPGIILGGIWADYSWGRFWGWDPKETWALIALLGYIAVLHGRLVGWIKDFGMVVSAILTFSLVIMAWYGVNFVLGAGLHSYGFGAGGVEYVSGFVALHLLAVVFIAALRKNRQVET